jgi:hypothetical protein
MLSGGVTLPRERLNEQQFRRIFDKGERYRLLELLLQRTVCSVDQRIASADEILRELEKIEAWEQNARLLPISDGTLKAIEQLQRRSLETGRIVAESKQARRQEAETLAAVQLSLSDWIKGELEKFVPLISSDSIKCEVGDAGMPASPQFVIETGPNSAYGALSGVEITFEDEHDPSNRKHLLQFFLCRHSKAIVTVTEGWGAPSVAPQPVRDIELAVLPFYRQMLKHLHPSASSAMGYLNPIRLVGSARGRVIMPARGQPQGPAVSYERVQPISRSFHHGMNLHLDFRASEWPGNVDNVRALLKDSIDTFISFINSGGQQLGP